MLQPVAFRPLKSAALAFVLSAASLSAQSSADDIVLGALRIGSLQDLASAAGSFANTVKPGAGETTARLISFISEGGIDPAGEVLGLLIDPRLTQEPYAIVLPVADPEHMKADKGLSFQPTADPDIYIVTNLGPRSMAATFVGKRLVASPYEAGLKAVLPLIKSGEDIRQLRAAGGQLALSLSTARLYAAYKPMLDLMLAGVRGKFSQASSKPGRPTVNPADMLGCFLGSLGELRTVSLRFSIQPESLEIRSFLEATPGTATATLLSPGRGPTVTTLGLHDPASAFLGTLSARPSPEFCQAYQDLTARLLVTSGAPGAKETSDALRKAMDNFASVSDGSVSFGMGAPGGSIVTGSGIAGITDPAQALTVIKTLPELQKNMVAINAPQGFTTDAVLGSEESYHDATLIDFTRTTRATDPAAKDEVFKMMQKMGMDHLSATYAVTPKRVLYSMGEGSHEIARRLVDAPERPALISPATYGFPEQATVFVAISLPRYLALITSVMDLPFKAAPVAPDTKPGLALSADLDAGRADIRVHLASAEIAALMNMATPPPAPAPVVAPAPSASGQ